MDGITCDMCGKGLLVDEEVRYVADVKVFAAYDVMEMTTDDLESRNLRAEMRAVLKALDGRDAKELEEEIFAERRFALCPSCRKKFLASLPKEQSGEGH